MNNEILREKIISLKNVTKFFSGRKIIQNVSLDIYRGETFVIMGCSGSGKTTLLKLMTGIIKPDEGSISIKGKEISQMDSRELDEVRKRLGMVFQHSALIDSLNVEDNVALPIREHTAFDEDMIKTIAKMKLSLVGLNGFEDYDPSEISGGMCKRVGLARAFALDPDIVFYDEPTSGLDPVIGGVINQLIMDLSKKLLVTSVVVTHDIQSVFRIADKVAMVHKGEVVQMGTQREMRNSDNPYVKQFIEGSPKGPIDFFRQNIDVFKEFSLLRRRCP